jgi:hypothetical protein
VVGVAAVLALVAGGVSVATDHGPFAGREPQVVGPGSDGSLSTYEKKVLAEVDGAYAVGGDVVVPWPLAPADRVAPLVGSRVATGLHGYGELGLNPPSTTSFPAFVRKPRQGAPVFTDYGPVSLGCVQGPDPACLVVLLAGDASRPTMVDELASASDLVRGARVRLLVRPSWSDHVRRTNTFGGFDGVATTVRLTLEGGQRVDADVDAGNVSDGDTLFWSSTDKPVRRVTAYAADGSVFRDQRVRDCDTTNTCGDPLG